MLSISSIHPGSLKGVMQIVTVMLLELGYPILMAQYILNIYLLSRHPSVNSGDEFVLHNRAITLPIFSILDGAAAKEWEIRTLAIQGTMYPYRSKSRPQRWIRTTMKKTQ
jgi:hypothetical protein